MFCIPGRFSMAPTFGPRLTGHTYTTQPGSARCCSPPCAGAAGDFVGDLIDLWEVAEYRLPANYYYAAMTAPPTTSAAGRLVSRPFWRAEAAVFRRPGLDRALRAAGAAVGRPARPEDFVVVGLEGVSRRDRGFGADRKRDLRRRGREEDEHRSVVDLSFCVGTDRACRPLHRQWRHPGRQCGTESLSSRCSPSPAPMPSATAT
jgi:hypothetical protein